MDRLVVILVAQVFNGCLLPFFSICLRLCINDEQFMGRWESQISLPRSPFQHCHLSQVPSEGLAQHLPCDWSNNHPPARQQRHRAEGENDLPKTKHGETLNSHWRKTSKEQKLSLQVLSNVMVVVWHRILVALGMALTAIITLSLSTTLGASLLK